MPLVSRLAQLLARGSAPERQEAAEPDERLAAAALLVHVARVDGRLVGPERARLAELFRDRFKLDAAGADDLIAAADAADRASDVITLIDVIGRDAPERRRLVAMAYQAAAADGVIAEFEDDLVWRLGRLLGLDPATLRDIRDAELVAAEPGTG